MDTPFAKRFLAARDADQSPFESWRRKERAHIPKGVDLCFVQPLERLTIEDVEGLLLCAAESGARYVVCNYRFELTHRDEILRLHCKYLGVYFWPLTQAGLIGGGGGIPYRRDDASGMFCLPLYSMKDTPPEDLRVISTEDVREQLEALGCRRGEWPKITEN